MTARRKDENGFLHVFSCNLTKEGVNPYYGMEIPHWQELRLIPDHVYYVYRPKEEIEKAANTFNGLPLLLGHYIESAAAPQKEYRVGSVGTDVKWQAPYLKGSLSVTDEKAIHQIETGQAKELSCAYIYDPELKNGVFRGEPYEIIMRNIRGNHVALVPSGRAGSDVTVADAQTIKFLNKERGEIIVNPENFKIDEILAQFLNESDRAKLKLQLMPFLKETVETVEDADENLEKDAEPKQGAGEEEPSEDNRSASSSLGGIHNDDDNDIVKDATDAPEDVIAAVKDALRENGLDVDDEQVLNAALMGYKMQADPDKKTDKDSDKVEEPNNLTDEEKEEIKEAARLNKAMDAGRHCFDAMAIEKKLLEKLKIKSNAAQDVRTVLGNVDPLTFDSAESIYASALKHVGVNIKGEHPTAYRGMWKAFQEAARRGGGVKTKSITNDSAIGKRYTGMFAGLNNIR